MNRIALKAIIFDFDGVILNSSSLKSQIFERFYNTFDDVAQEMIAYHYANKGMSRYNQFIQLCKCIGEEPTKENVDKHVLRFREILMVEMFKCPFIEGAENFLNAFYKRLPLFVASNSPKVELDIVVQKRSIQHCFIELFGTTFQEKKTDFINEILEKYSLLKDEVVFIGDTLKDLDAANECGLNFIGIENSLTKFPKNVLTFDSLTAVEGYILNNYKII